MVLISGTTFSAMGVPKLLYKAIFYMLSENKLSVILFLIFQKFASENLQ